MKIIHYEEPSWNSPSVTSNRIILAAIYWILTTKQKFSKQITYFFPLHLLVKWVFSFFFPITWLMRRLRFESLMWISPQELGAGMKIQTWPLHHCLIPALINISYCLYKMILSAWRESVLARNCNLIPVVIPHLLGSVNPIYVINGEMGLSKPNMHGKAENVVKGMKGPGGSNRERWRLRKTRKPMLIQRGQNYRPNPLLSLTITRCSNAFRS